MKAHPFGPMRWNGLLAVLLLSAMPAAAEEPLVSGGGSVSMEAFRRIPIMLDGRKVPLDTYARHTLLQFTGRSSRKEEPAVAWLARVLFRPETTWDDDLFLINHPEVAEALNMQVDEHRRYPFAEIEPSLFVLRDLATRASAIESKDRGVVDKEVIRLYVNVNLYLALQQTFGFAVPMDDVQPGPELRALLELKDDDAPYSFLDVVTHAGRLEGTLDPLKGKDPAEWTPLEQNAFSLSAALFHRSRQYRNLPFELIPMTAHGGETWLSPWDALALAGVDRSLYGVVHLLQSVRKAYLAGDQQGFDAAANEFANTIRSQRASDREMKHLDLEVLYNKLDLFYRAEVLYGLVLLVGFTALVSGKRGMWILGFALLLLALIPHTAGIVARMIIMGRPPMTNLYATFVFVAWVAVLLCLLVECAQRNGLGLFTGGLTGLALLLLSMRFAVEGDEMGKVVAVLDSNFWLSTHVVCITLGYAGCMVAGILGHMYMFQALVNAAAHERLRSTFRALFAVLGFGLTFSFFGTMLGGVWADQSWGRFWGWDPKENGALLIVLWCSMLFHARLAKVVNDLGLAVGAALGMIVVMFAWLGVNLLGVGLHSYGFTSGVANALFAYTALQLVLLLVITNLTRVADDQRARLARCARTGVIIFVVLFGVVLAAGLREPPAWFSGMEPVRRALLGAVAFLGSVGVGWVVGRSAGVVSALPWPLPGADAVNMAPSGTART